MKLVRRHRSMLLLVCLVACTVVTAVGVSSADVYKNKQTGEVIRGTLTDQMINNFKVFKFDNGGTKFVNPDDWELVEKTGDADEAPADTAAEEPEDQADADDDDDEQETGKGMARVYVIPVEGPIESKALVKATKEELIKAKKRRCDLIIFRMDTPGGRVDVAKDMIDIIGEIDFARVIAWVNGKVQNGAISAGAYISLGAEAIYMSEGTSLGGAVPYRIVTGSAEVDSKMQSIFRATFRALAEKRGYPSAVVDAMVDSSTEVVQVFIDGEQRIVKGEEVADLRKQHGDKFRRGKTIVEKDEVLTLTTDEAIEYGVATAQANSMDQLVEEILGYDSYRLYEAGRFTERVKKVAEESKRTWDAAATAFSSNIEQAALSDPARYGYEPGSSQYRRMSMQCRGYLRKCAEALKVIEGFAKDPDADIYVPQSEIDNWKMRLETFYRRLGQNM